MGIDIVKVNEKVLILKLIYFFDCMVCDDVGGQAITAFRLISLEKSALPRDIDIVNNAGSAVKSRRFEGIRYRLSPRSFPGNVQYAL
jgi:hypothetical protein